MTEKILVIGASGQIGTDLTIRLRSLYGADAVIASDIKEGTDELMQTGIFEILDATFPKAILGIVKKHKITQIYHMAAMLSVIAERFPDKAWNLNMNSLLHVLDLAKEEHVKKVFWPSSIAVFGPTTPKIQTPQVTIMEPTTVYGISKLAGERWCSYYKEKHKVDVRSVRYPGIISWKTLPGGGTTDYAVEIYHEALKNKEYTSFLGKDTRLPMMYMDDAIKATIDMMQAQVPVHFYSYNIAAMDFTPEEIATSVQKQIPDFKMKYEPDFRQQIADSWPQTIDDSFARKHWGWEYAFDLDSMTADMFKNLKMMYSL